MDSRGELILCTLREFEEAMAFNDDDLISDEVYDVEDEEVEGDKLTNDVADYTPTYCKNMPSYIFTLFSSHNTELRAATLLSQNDGKINRNWILLDS